MTRDPRRAYRVVDSFEWELAAYCGSPYAVATNSCTNALLLALSWERLQGVKGPIKLPRRTYVGVAQSVRNAGFDIEWDDGLTTWQDVWGWYWLKPALVADRARTFGRWCYPNSRWYDAPDGCGHHCISLHSAKQLPLGRGGAILTDNADAAKWFRAARMDGRPPGEPIQATVTPAWHCPMAPDVAARGLDILSRWHDAGQFGYSPPPLAATDYPDLSLLDFSNSQNAASSQPAPKTPVETSSKPQQVELR